MCGGGGEDEGEEVEEVVLVLGSPPSPLHTLRRYKESSTSLYYSKSPLGMEGECMLFLFCRRQTKHIHSPLRIKN